MLTEDFDYTAATTLYEQGDWLRSGGNTESPITITSGSLTYTGYSDEGVGNSISLTDTKSGEDCMKFFNSGEKVGSGVVYASMLVNVKSMQETSDPTYFFGLVPETKNGLSDGGNAVEYGRIFIVPGSSGSNEFQFGLSRAGAYNKSVTYSQKFNYNTTYLLVVKYEIIEGYSNDKVSLWVNPLIGGSEPTASLIYSEGTDNDASVNYGGLKGILIRQGTSAKSMGANLQVDAIRVAKTWGDLFDNAGENPPSTATTMTVAGGPYNYDMLVRGMTEEAMAVVTVQNATDDVTITCTPGITPDRVTIPVSELSAAVPVTFTINPQLAETGEWNGTATFSTAGADDVVMTFSAMVYVPIDVNQAVQFQNYYVEENYDTYLYKGNIVVTHIERENNGWSEYDLIYAQDLTGAVCFTTEYLMEPENSGIKVGDELTNVLVAVAPDAVGYKLYIQQFSEAMPFTIKSSGKTKTPVEVDDSFDPAANQYKLVKLTNVQFNETGTFTDKTYDVTATNGAAKVKPFAGTDLIGSAIPTTATEVIGISYSKSIITIRPRSQADVVTAGASVDFTKQTLFDFTTDAAPINADTDICKIKVDATGLAAAATVSVTGANADLFSVSPSVIPAGTSSTEIIVTYSPTSPGRHTASLYLNFDGTDSELNKTISLGTCMAYDPENLPVLEITPSELTLNAQVGASDRATATLKVRNAFDYVYAARQNADAQGITISSTQYLPSISEQLVTITFQPKKAGNVDQSFLFTTLKGESVLLTVHGITSGTDQPEEPQGGELVLDETTSHSLYAQDFSTVLHNKPLELPEWSNVAEVGTRAWWGYVSEEFTAAKVTAYDSKMATGEGEPCKMLLVSPALDYANAAYKTLKFRLMGKGLYDGMTDLLEICLVEKEGTDVYITPMDGFNVPVTSDMDSEWIPYEVDMSVIPDMPSVFWIGYRFTSTRGHDNAAQYFITDFVWGEAATLIGGIVADSNNGYVVYSLQGVKVMETNEASDLNRLPKGIYIINGKKHAIR